MFLEALMKHTVGGTVSVWLRFAPWNQCEMLDFRSVHPDPDADFFKSVVDPDRDPDSNEFRTATFLKLISSGRKSTANSEAADQNRTHFFSWSQYQWSLKLMQRSGSGYMQTNDADEDIKKSLPTYIFVRMARSFGRVVFADPDPFPDPFHNISEYPGSEA